MWIQKKPNGKYQFFERYTDPMTGKKKTVSVLLDKNRRVDREAASAALRQRIQALTITAVNCPDITFRALCEVYTKAQKDGAVKEQTAVSNERRMNTLRKKIGDTVIVSKLTAPYVRNALKADLPETYNERLTRFKALMRWAYREELVADISYLDKLQREKTQSVKEKDKDKYLEKDEVTKLLTGMKVDDWRMLTQFLILTGLRIGEAIALNEDDVDLKARQITVNKTYSREIGKISTTKTETSTRIVSIQDELYDCCLEILQRKWKIASITGRSSELFFPDPNHGYINYDVYAKYFRENTEALIGRKLTPHALRHTHVALLAENRIPLDVISRRLGHADSAITKNIYFHVTKRLQEQDADMLKNIKIV